MENVLQKLVVELGLNSSGYQNGMKSAATSTSNFAKNALSAIGVTFSIAAAMYAAKKAFDTVTKAAMESEDANAKLASILKSTSAASGQTMKSLNDQAAAIQKVTTFDDELVKAGQATLLTFTNIGGKVFPKAVIAMTNMAAKTGDMSGAAAILGKVLNDPLKYMGLLARQGLALSDVQTKQIEHFMAINDLASAQGVILDMVNTKFGGLAEAMGNTAAGKIQIAKNALEEMYETIGTALLPVIGELANALTTWLSSPAVEAGINDVVGWLGGVATTIGEVVKGFEAFQLTKTPIIPIDPGSMGGTGGGTFTAGKTGGAWVDKPAGTELSGVAQAAFDLAKAFDNVGTALDKINLALDLDTWSSFETIVKGIADSMTAVAKAIDWMAPPGVSSSVSQEDAALKQDRLDRFTGQKPFITPGNWWGEEVKLPKLDFGGPGGGTGISLIPVIDQWKTDWQTISAEPAIAITASRDTTVQSLSDITNAMIANAQTFIVPFRDIGDSFMRELSVGVLGGQTRLTEAIGHTLLSAVSNAVGLLLGGVIGGGGGGGGGKSGIKWPTSKPGELPDVFKAAGGPVLRGNPYVVGERGPELFVPPSNGKIIPNNKLDKRTSGSNVMKFFGPVTFVSGKDSINADYLSQVKL
jgi:hypothetical protein